MLTYVYMYKWRVGVCRKLFIVLFFKILIVI